MTNEPQARASALPDLTDDLLARLREIYHTAPPAEGGGPARHDGIAAVYRYLQGLTTAPGAADHPPTEPWDVLVWRGTGDNWEPVRQLVEAVAVLSLAFPGVDMTTARFADPRGARSTGHLLVDVLPREVMARLLAGQAVDVELPTVGYRVTVPSGSLGLDTPAVPVPSPSGD